MTLTTKSSWKQAALLSSAWLIAILVVSVVLRIAGATIGWSVHDYIVANVGVLIAIALALAIWFVHRDWRVVFLVYILGLLIGIRSPRSATPSPAAGCPA